MEYKCIKTSITINKTEEEILDRYCKIENRSRSNMISQMIRSYDNIMKQKY